MADSRHGLREDVVDMSLDPDEDDVPLGFQRYQGEQIRAELVYASISKLNSTGRAVWCKDVEVVLTRQPGSKVRLCFLKCTFCHDLISPSNPSDSCNSHYKPNNCKGKSDAGKAQASGIPQTKSRGTLRLLRHACFSFGRALDRRWDMLNCMLGLNGAVDRLPRLQWLLRFDSHYLCDMCAAS